MAQQRMTGVVAPSAPFFDEGSEGGGGLSPQRRPIALGRLDEDVEIAHGAEAVRQRAQLIAECFH
jgi:hypothetical protein